MCHSSVSHLQTGLFVKLYLKMMDQWNATSTTGADSSVTKASEHNRPPSVSYVTIDLESIPHFSNHCKTYYYFRGLLWWYSFSFSCKNIISGQIAYDIYPQLPIIAKKSFTEISPVTCIIDTLLWAKHGTRFNGEVFRIAMQHALPFCEGHVRMWLMLCGDDCDCRLIAHRNL